jgi:hypothetical protein
MSPSSAARSTQLCCQGWEFVEKKFGVWRTIVVLALFTYARTSIAGIGYVIFKWFWIVPWEDLCKPTYLVIIQPSNYPPKSGNPHSLYTSISFYFSTNSAPMAS